MPMFQAQSWWNDSSFLAYDRALVRKLAKKVTARKDGGDDAGSWAVFVEGKVFVNGLTSRETPYYKRQALLGLLKKRDG